MAMQLLPELTRCRSGRWWICTVFLSFSCILAGCGGSTDEPAPSLSEDLPNNPSATENVSDLPDESISGSQTESQSGPASDTGMQLPESDLPSSNGSADDKSATDPDSGGPAKPGSGGIEMPSIEPSSADQSRAKPDAAANSVTPAFASWSAIETHAKSTGTITVVDLWSTVCAPCVKEFPGLVRLSKQMQPSVTCIGVSVDYDGRKSRPPESYSEKVGAFLTAVGADFDNYVCNTPSDDVYATVGLPSIPAVLIYDAKGNLVKQFVDSGDTIGFSYESDIIPFVEKLAG